MGVLEVQRDRQYRVRANVHGFAVQVLHSCSSRSFVLILHERLQSVLFVHHHNLLDGAVGAEDLPHHVGRDRKDRLILCGQSSEDDLVGGRSARIKLLMPRKSHVNPATSDLRLGVDEEVDHHDGASQIFEL